MMVTLMDNFFHKPWAFNFGEMLTKEKWNFAKDLLNCVLDKKEYCLEIIKPKVTINEYIDLAKEYSTPQSGHFVNGILDNIHKELISQNKIHKKNFRNST